MIEYRYLIKGGTIMAEEKKKCNDEPLLNIDNEIIPSQAKKLKCYANCLLWMVENILKAI